MISVTFTSDVENIVATEHLYQWDNGQKLSISGVGTSADIHFANKKSEKALVVTPTVTSGKMVAPIPNSLLSEPYPIIAYVYVPSDDGSKTIKSVTINIEARKQPSDFVLTEDEGVTTIETISQRVNELLQNATNQINTAVSNMQTDYTNFKNTIQDELDDMKANTTVPNADTVDGKHASEIMVEKVSDTAELVTLDGLQGGVPFSDITVSGKNLLKYPYADTTKTENGITFTDNGDGSITANGTATNTAKFYISLPLVLPIGEYTVSDGSHSAESEGCHIQVYTYDAPYTTLATTFTNKSFVLTKPTALTVRISVSNGYTVDNLVIKPQIERGSAATEYESYSGASYTITPDSNPYTVPNDIRQQDGINNVSVSAGEVSVTGVNQNKAFKVIYKRGVSANGGNADTVGNKNLSQIMKLGMSYTDRVKITKGNLNDLRSEGKYVVPDGKTAALIGGSPFTDRGYFLDVNYRTALQTIQIAMSWTGVIKIRYSSSDGDWYNWNLISDGGNAKTANTAKTANIANTAGTLATTPTNVCLRNISFGTANAQVEDPSAEGYVAPGALYGQYEEVTT